MEVNLWLYFEFIEKDLIVNRKFPHINLLCLCINQIVMFFYVDIIVKRSFLAEKVKI